jgi:hypothetical protein
MPLGAFRFFRTRATADSTGARPTPQLFGCTRRGGASHEIRELRATDDQESALPGDHQHSRTDSVRARRLHAFPQ